MWIWQEAGNNSSQWVAELEPELGPVSSWTKKTRQAEWLKKKRQNIGGRGRCWTSELHLADFWRNNDFEFFRKSMPRMGPGHSGLQKSLCKMFALKLHSFWIKPQEGMGWPFAPLKVHLHEIFLFSFFALIKHQIIRLLNFFDFFLEFAD